MTEFADSLAVASKAAFLRLGAAAAYTAAADPASPINTRVIMRYDYKEGMPGEAPGKMLPATGRAFVAAFPRQAVPGLYDAPAEVLRDDAFPLDGVTYVVQKIVKQNPAATWALVKPQ